MRRIHRDRSEAEQKELNRSISDFGGVLEQIERGELSVDALPEDLVKNFRKITRREKN